VAPLPFDQGDLVNPPTPISRLPLYDRIADAVGEALQCGLRGEDVFKVLLIQCINTALALDFTREEFLNIVTLAFDQCTAHLIQISKKGGQA
jgi:hypothetical protein